jgi:mycoredoxin
MVAADFVRRRCKAVFGVKVYGADWCEDTRHAREFLDRLGVQYQYVNIEQDEPAAAWVREHSGGRERMPTVDIAGQMLTVPSDHELTSALRERGLMA